MLTLTRCGVITALAVCIMLCIDHQQYNRQINQRHPYETEDSSTSVHGPAYARDTTDYAAAAVCDAHATHAAVASMSARHSVRAAVLAAVQMLGDEGNVV
jgi:hypothetical protein